MPNLKVSPGAGNGKIISVTPQSAGWTHVGFDLHRLAQGQTASGLSPDRETCLVLVSGKARISVGGHDFGLTGGRMTPFEGKPWSAFVPAGQPWTAAAETALELAACSAPDLGGGHAARIIHPDALGQEVRGKGSNTRYVTNILPETDKGADSLLVVEVITPGGHTSSYPPHKHDRNDLPRESLLEETYYHRLNPPQGFAFQRVYTDTDENGVRELDEAISVADGDVVLVPKGYHPCAAIHGYDLYYLNVMAGPVRIWKFHNETGHQWLLKA